MKDGFQERVKILMIEDDGHLAKSQQKVLKDGGFEVDWASSGEKGLEMARTLQPDLILLDVKLPDTNGYTVCELIKSDPELRNIFIIIITGSKVKSEDQAKGLEIGADGYIVRPIPNRELLARLLSYDRIIRNEKELRRTRDELQTANIKLMQSNQDLQSFAYAISHDLQEPLRMVTSFLSLLEKQYAEKLDQNAREYIDFSVDGALRMKGMIDGVLEFSRVNTHGGDFEWFSSQRACQQAVDALRLAIADRNGQVLFSDLPEVFGDPVQISQLFQNLISNGIRFNQADQPLVKVTASQEDGDWIFAVEDNGIGIPEKDQARIFEIFTRLHTRDEFPGNGVGLSICKRIIERHKGSFWLESEPGRGSVFYFSLPTAEEHQILDGGK